MKIERKKDSKKILDSQDTCAKRYRDTLWENLTNWRETYFNMIMCAEIGHQETAERRCNKTHYEPWSILVSATICILAGDICSHRLPIFVLRKNTFVSTLKFWMGLKKLEKFPMLIKKLENLPMLVKAWKKILMSVTENLNRWIHQQL